MNIVIIAGPAATERDLRMAKAERQLLTGELARVRTSALAWRNGIAALLAGLVGFGLVKGRTDIGDLAQPWSAMVGTILASALVCGAVAAIKLMRAAHGRPHTVAIRDVLDNGSEDPVEQGRLAEAEASAQALYSGVKLSFVCVALLCCAVAMTWYGPAKTPPRVQVRVGGGTVCGEALELTAGRLVLKTRQGRATVDLAQAQGITAVDSCAPVQK